MVEFNDACFYIDCDDTLVTWTGSSYKVSQDVVNMIKKAYERNQSVVIWSAGGHKWAERCAKEAGIAHLCYAFLAKPRWTVDDSKNPLENSIPVAFKDAFGKEIK